VGRPAPRYYASREYLMNVVPTQTGTWTVSGPNDLFAGDIRPERKREFEVGFSSRSFNNRLELNFSYYTNNVYDQIMTVPLASLTGATGIRINAGNVRNWGYELFAKGTVIRTEDYRWDLTFTMANQYSKVIKLHPGITRVPIGGNGYSVVADEGKRFGEILMFDYARDPNGRRLVSESGSYYLNPDELVSIGRNVNPDFFGGFMSNFQWRGFFAHVGLDYKFGGSIFSYSNYYLTGLGLTKNTLKYRDEATGGLPYYVDANNNTVRLSDHNAAVPLDPDPVTGLNRNGVRQHNGMILDGLKVTRDALGEIIGYEENDIVLSSTAYYQSFLVDNPSASNGFQPDALFKNDYIKLREVSIGYTLPQRWSEAISVQKVTVSLIARNLFYLYKTLPNVDAESILGTTGQNAFHEQSFLPTIRTYGFGINVSF
jgi:iron complex outermembrane receptor protein